MNKIVLVDEGSEQRCHLRVGSSWNRPGLTRPDSALLCIASKLFDPLRIMKAFPICSEVPKVVLVEVLLTTSYEAVITSVRPRWREFNKL